MKKIIKGKVYDTETAKKLGSYSYSNSSDFHHWYEALYQKRNGEYFLYGEGGPLTRYAVAIEQNSWSGGEKIMPLSFASAREWAEEHLSANEYEEIFGLPDEDAEKVTMCVQLPADLMALIRAQAAEAETSMAAYVGGILSRECRK